MSTFIVALALGLTEAIWLIVDRPISSPLFLGAIVLSAWLCGFRSGVFAAVISAFIIDYYFVQPIYHFTGDFDEVARLLVFAAEGTFICWLVEVRRTAVEEIKSTGEKLRALTVRQQTLRETEQKRIALEIHDELGQALTGLKMDVHWLNRTIEEQPGDIPKRLLSEKLSELLRLIDTTVSSVRRIATDIRPSVLDDFGLIAAIEWQAKEFERKSGVECVFSSDSDSLNLDSDANTAVFRIFQEALTNVTRHSQASTVHVKIGTADQSVRMSVEDDGVGIDLGTLEHPHSLGILGMQERARLIGATLDIFNGANGGTSIGLTIPENRGSFANGGLAG
ncbi:MAG TPA: sensor histidine kinase [Pyrinomonadaceae bacterium]|nr:sensor histidine kinase [Pyrinomonadaceae bacterium]